jgi:type III secretory pathway component EscS
MNDLVEKPKPVAKQRYSLVTLYLWLALIANVAGTFLALGHLTDLQARAVPFPIGLIPVVGVLSLAGPACIVALLCWKKWGFWGCVGQAVLVALVRILRHDDLVLALGGLVGCLILYLVLQAGDEKRAWLQLE